MTLDPKAIADLIKRLGHDPAKWQQGAWLEDPLVRALAAERSVDLAGVRRDRAEQITGLWTLARATKLLGPMGWTVSGNRLPATTWAEAVALVDGGSDPSRVDALMAKAWADRVNLRATYGMLPWLYGPDDASIELMLGRICLLDQALEDHLAGRHAGSILIVLSQIDGITLDATSDVHGFFIGARKVAFEDDLTIAGLPDNLEAVRRLVDRTVYRTTLDGRLERHPIFHGRELAYATEVNSAKAFSLLGSLVDWLKSKYGKSPV